MFKEVHGGHRQHRQVPELRVAADLPGGAVAVHHRHLAVHQHQLHGMLLHLLERLCEITGQDLALPANTGLEAVEAVVPDAGDDVDPGEGPVPLQGGGSDAAGGDVVEVLGHPHRDRRRCAGGQGRARVAFGLQGADLGDDLASGGRADVAAVPASAIRRCWSRR